MDNMICFYNDDPKIKASELEVAIDLEWYDQSGKKDKDYPMWRHRIQEIGIAVQPKDRTAARYFCLIITENQNLVSTHLTKNPLGFQFGDKRSETFQTTRQALDRLEFFLRGAGNECPVTVIYHGGTNDREALSRNNLNLQTFMTGDYDTLLHYQAQAEDAKSSLDIACVRMGVPFNNKWHHNAGNDAAYTLHLYNALERYKFEEDPIASGDKWTVYKAINWSVNERYLDVDFFPQIGIYGVKTVVKKVPKRLRPGGLDYLKSKDIDRKFCNLIRQFNDEVSNLDLVLDVLSYEVIESYIVEQFLPRYHDFARIRAAPTSLRTELFGGCSDLDKVAEAFSHFSYHHTGGQVMITDICGEVANGVKMDVGHLKSFFISIPSVTILSVAQTEGYARDTGLAGMQEFFRKHKCNQYCNRNWLSL